MLVTFMAVLLIACPCALGLAAPISSAVGISKAAQSGIIMRNSNIFSELPKIDVVVLTNINENDLEIVKKLVKKGLKIILLTHNDTVAGNLPNPLFEYIGTGLSPSEIENKLKDLIKTQRKIAILSDNPTASYIDDKKVIKIATGIESYKDEKADIAILRNSLSGFLEAFLITKATSRNIKQNLSGAFIYNFLGIPIAAGVFYPLLHVLLNPILAGALMAASSLVVVLNANRLQLFNPRARANS